MSGLWIKSLIQLLIRMSPPNNYEPPRQGGERFRPLGIVLLVMILGLVILFMLLEGDEQGTAPTQREPTSTTPLVETSENR